MTIARTVFGLLSGLFDYTLVLFILIAGQRHDQSLTGLKVKRSLLQHLFGRLLSFPWGLTEANTSPSVARD